MVSRIATGRRRIATLAALVITGGLPLAALGAAPAGAAVSVTTEAEIRAAFASEADSTINLTTDIVLDDCTSALVWSSDSDLTITGNGHTLSVSPTCSPTPHGVIQFLIGAGAAVRTLTVHNLTITGGKATLGGGITAQNGTGDVVERADVVLDQGSVVTGNVATSEGGGIYAADGNVTIDHSTLSNNDATFDGGGVKAPSSGTGVTVRDSTVSGNDAGQYGGGIRSSDLTAERSTFNGNTAGRGGGGVRADGAIAVTNSTITANTASAASGDSGGGLFAQTGANVAIKFSTIVGNTTIDTKTTNVEIVGTGGTRSIFGSVIATPLATSGTAVSCSGGGLPTTSGYNFSEADSCGFGAGTGDIEAGGNPSLGALANNGGPTLTMLPALASPLRNQVPAGDCTTQLITDQDQRAEGRPSAGLCEIGATERQAPGFPTGVSATPHNASATIAFSPPADGGDSALTGSTATCTPSAGPVRTGTSATSPITVSSMVNGTAYSCTVHATSSDGNGAESAPVPVVGLFQPDIQARKSNVGVFTDPNTYAVALTSAGNVALGGTATYFAKLFNDGNVAQSINLKALLTGTTKMAVTFKDGAATLAGMTTTGRNFTLAPGGSKTITILVKANTGTAKKATRTVTLTAKSNVQTTKTDQVKVKATRI